MCSRRERGSKKKKNQLSSVCGLTLCWDLSFSGQPVCVEFCFLLTLYQEIYQSHQVFYEDASCPGHVVLSKFPGMHKYFLVLPVSKREFIPAFPPGLLACLWTIIFCPRHLCLFFGFVCHIVIWGIPSTFLPCVSSELVKRIRCVLQ